MRKLFTFILIFTCLRTSWAQDFGQVNQNFELKIKLLNSIVQTNQKLELMIENYPVQVEGEIAESFVLEFEKTAKEYMERQSRIVGMSEADQNILKRILSRMNWSELGKLYLKTWQKMKAMSRGKGMGLVAALVLTNMLNWIAPYFLTMLGQPALAAIIFATPLNPPTIFLHHVVTRYQMKREMVKILGSNEAYKEFLERERKIKELLSTKDSSYFFIPLDDKASELAVARTKSFKRTVLSYFGIKSQGLDSDSLREFVLEHKLEEHSILAILDDKNLNEDIRLTMAIRELFNIENDEVLANFKIKYSSFLLTKPPTAHEVDELSRWVSSILKAKSDQDIFLLIEQAPRNIHPYHIVSTWEQIILPALAANDQVSYRQIRGLINGLRSFKINQELKINEISSLSIIADMKAYFRASTSSRRSCFKTHQEAINLLLAN